MCRGLKTSVYTVGVESYGTKEKAQGESKGKPNRRQQEIEKPRKEINAITNNIE